MSEEMKQCRMCGELKPFSRFSPVKENGHIRRHSYCKPCRSKSVVSARKVGRQGDTSPTAWKVPTMTFGESLQCITLRKWRGPCEPGLRARL